MITIPEKAIPQFDAGIFDAWADGRPADTHDRIALPVAGDDPDAKSLVMRLVDEMGFDPVDAGA